jgi:hypothetical protein
MGMAAGGIEYGLVGEAESWFVMSAGVEAVAMRVVRCVQVFGSGNVYQYADVEPPLRSG